MWATLKPDQPMGTRNPTARLSLRHLQLRRCRPDRINSETFSTDTPVSVNCRSEYDVAWRRKRKDAHRPLYRVFATDRRRTSALRTSTSLHGGRSWLPYLTAKELTAFRPTYF